MDNLFVSDLIDIEHAVRSLRGKGGRGSHVSGGSSGYSGDGSEDMPVWLVVVLCLVPWLVMGIVFTCIYFVYKRISHEATASTVTPLPSKSNDTQDEGHVDEEAHADVDAQGEDEGPADGEARQERADQVTESSVVHAVPEANTSILSVSAVPEEATPNYGKAHTQLLR